jgi:hypothetical protein
VETVTFSTPSIALKYDNLRELFFIGKGKKVT